MNSFDSWWSPEAKEKDGKQQVFFSLCDNQEEGEEEQETMEIGPSRKKTRGVERGPVMEIVVDDDDKDNYSDLI